MNRKIMIYVSIMLLLFIGIQNFAGATPMVELDEVKGVLYDEELDEVKNITLAISKIYFSEDGIGKGEGYLNLGSSKINAFFENIEYDEHIDFYVGDAKYLNEEESYSGSLYFNKDRTIISGTIDNFYDSLNVHFVSNENIDPQNLIDKIYQNYLSVKNEELDDTVGLQATDENLRNNILSNGIRLHFVGASSLSSGTNGRYQIRTGVNKTSYTEYTPLRVLTEISPTQYSSGRGVSVIDTYPQTSNSNFSISVGYAISPISLSFGVSTSSSNRNIGRNSETSYNNFRISDGNNKARWDGTISVREGVAADYYIELLNPQRGSSYGYSVRSGFELMNNYDGTIWTIRTNWARGSLTGN